jgi:4-coumarate--CoA ligase
MIVHRSPLPDIDIPEIPITDYVLKEAARVPDRPALIDGPTGRTYT